MKATALLREQHAEITRLFDRVEDTTTEEDEVAVFERLAAMLTAHDAMERHVLYPRCIERMGMNEQLGESLVEHGLIEFGLYQALDALGSEDFTYKCNVLSDLVLHHVKEEEDEFFLMIDDAFDEDEQLALGEELERHYEAAMAEDFRRALMQNLVGVLKGALNPPPPNGSKKPRKATPAKSERARHR
jgi:hypothetical protein